MQSIARCLLNGRGASDNLLHSFGRDFGEREVDGFQRLRETEELQKQSKQLSNLLHVPTRIYFPWRS